MIIEKDLSKTQVELVCKSKRNRQYYGYSRIRFIQSRTNKEKATSEALEGRNRAISNMKPALEAK